MAVCHYVIDSYVVIVLHRYDEYRQEIPKEHFKVICGDHDQKVSCTFFCFIGWYSFAFTLLSYDGTGQNSGMVRKCKATNFTWILNYHWHAQQ